MHSNFNPAQSYSLNTSPQDKLAVSTPIFSIIFAAGPENVIKNM